MTTETKTWRDVLPPIFAACCARTDSRYRMSVPFQRGQFVCATDGRICVQMRMPEGLVLPDLAGMTTPPVESVMDGEFGPGVACPDPGSAEPDEPCEECKGNGKQYGVDCDECDGTGVEPPIHKPITVIAGQANLGDGLLRILFKNKATLYPPLKRKLDAWKFTIGDDIEGRVTPPQRRPKVVKPKPDKPLFPNSGRFHGLAKAIDVNGVREKMNAQPATAQDYRGFLESKAQVGNASGFEASWIPESLFPFQEHLTRWAIAQGRSAIFADCGLGKTPMQLVWGQNVVERTNRPVLALTPLAVSHQTVREAHKFGVDAEQSRDGKFSGARIVVTNYERLHYFKPEDFGGVICDESSILKNFDGATKAAVTEFMRTIQYRLLCTATAAPNDYHELGTSSEALGHLGYQDVLGRFFKEDVAKDYLGWGRKTFRFRGHAEEPFWRWVCSWSRSCRKPSDLGFDDGAFVLPPLVEQEIVVEASEPREGMLFAVPARNLQEQREERRLTLGRRCEQAAAIVAGHAGASVVWCHLNDEADEMERMIPGSKQVSGSMEDDEKEETLAAFSAEQLRVLVVKPKIACYGLNWQHCSNVVTFASHSWEQYYQSVRRCWRFGQKNPVTVSIVCSDGEHRVLENLRRKANAAEQMFQSLCRHMNEAMKISPLREFHQQERMPQWL